MQEQLLFPLQSMFMLSTLQYCNQTIFDKENITINDSAIVITVTQSGLDHYAAMNVNLANDVLRNTKIPDFAITVGIIDLVLYDIQIADTHFPPFNLGFTEDQTAQGSLDGVTIQLKLNFRVKMNTYPYTTDTGNGTIIMSKLFFSTTISEHENTECKYHLYIQPHSFKCDIGALQVILQSQLSFLYDSIINLITQTLTDVFNQKMGPILQDVFLGLSNSMLAEDTVDVSCNGKLEPVHMDQRWLLVNATSNYMFDTFVSGKVCYMINDNTCTGGLYDKPFYKRTQYFTDDNMQYFINKITINSQFNVAIQNHLLKLENSSITSCEVQSIVHTGLLTNCAFLVNNSSLNLSMLLQIKTESSHYNVTSVDMKFRPQVAQIISCKNDNNLCLNLDPLISSFNQMLSVSSSGIKNGINIDSPHCQVVYYSKDWLVCGCNVVWHDM